MLISIFAPEPINLRGDLTSAYLYARWMKNLDLLYLYTEQIDLPLKELADEFDTRPETRKVLWNELKPFYLEVHEYQDKQSSEAEITMLGLGYANILRALRLSNETYGERPSEDVNDILTEYLNTFTKLRSKLFTTSNFTNSLVRLIENDASRTEILICCYFAEYIARGDIEPEEIESIYLATDWSEGTQASKEEAFVNRIKEVIQERAEKREFLGEVDEIRTLAPNDGEVRTKNYLPIILDAAIALTRLVFGIR